MLDSSKAAAIVESHGDRVRVPGLGVGQPATDTIRVLRAAVLLGALLVTANWAPAAQAATAPPEAVDEPMSAAEKRPQAVSELAIPVTIITADEIRAHGFRTLGGALRWVRGMFVTSDRVYSYLGIRGIRRPGDFNNKILLAVDGHRMNGNVYGDSYLDASLGIDLDLVERIEIMHGPEADLYGNSAVLALVNIVMRRPRDGTNGVVAGRVGSASWRQVLASLSSARRGQPALSAAFSWLNVRGLDHYYREFDSPDTHKGLAVDADGERSRAFFGTADWNGLRLVAKFNERIKRIPTASFGTVFGDNRYRAYDGHDFVELSRDQPISPTFDMVARVAWDRAHYRATYVYDYGSGAVLNHDSGRGEVVSTEWRARWAPVGNAHVAMFGVEGQLKSAAQLSNYDIAPYALYLDAREQRTLFASYVNDRVRLAQDLHLTAGVRMDRWSQLDSQWSPSLGLTWRDPRGTEWKLHAAKAFRAPTAYETQYEATTVRRSVDLKPEQVGTLQATAVHTFGPARVLVTGYASDLKGLIDLERFDTLGTLQYRNATRVKCRGIEGEVEVTPATNTHVRIAVARQSSVAANIDEPLTNSPAWDGCLVFRHDPVQGRWSLGAGMRYMSPRLTRTGRETAAAFVTDARVGWRPGALLVVGLEAKNVFDARYGDPASDEFVQEQILQDPRAIFFTLALRSSGAP